MRAARSRLTAQLRSANQPTEAQLQRFDQFLTRTYKRKVPLRWEQDETLQDGFRLQVGSDVYDWSLRARQESIVNSYHHTQRYCQTSQCAA